MKKDVAKVLILILILLLIDQGIKFAKPTFETEIISFKYVENTGSAFGIGERKFTDYNSFKFYSIRNSNKIYGNSI